jgi:ABC-type nitrate/sulfonate/bicarbonate transport system substrate-binding protein
MEENRIAGSTVYEPVYSADIATGKVRVIGYPFDAIGKHFSDGVMFANVNWVNGHRDLVDRFLRVMQTASAYVGAHESEVVPYLAQFAGTDPVALAQIRHPGRGVAIGPPDVQPVIDLAAKYKVIPKTFLAQEMICNCALTR